jgi:diguanylate cyclase (GGDEF)-like protein
MAAAASLPGIYRRRIASVNQESCVSGSPFPSGAPFLHPEMLRSLPDWEDLLASGLRMTSRLLDARRCALLLVGATEDGREELAAAGVWDEVEGALLEELPALDDGLERCAVREAASITALLPATRRCGRGEAHARPNFCACAPLVLDDLRYGMLEVVRSAKKGPFKEAELQSLQLAALHLALCLRSSSAHLGLQKLADTDGLTGVFNYRRFQMQLEIEVERCDRHGRALSLMMLDLNNFKRYNDRFGHQQGDTALQSIAATLERTVRRVDVVARYGGDEFAVILPETGPSQALAVARRIEQAVREHGAAIPGPGAAECLAVSIGISSYPSLAQSKEDLIAQADEAMYRAKRLRTEMVRVWKGEWRKPSTKPLRHLGDPDARLRLFDVLPH